MTNKKGKREDNWRLRGWKPDTISPLPGYYSGSFGMDRLSKLERRVLAVKKRRDRKRC